MASTDGGNQLLRRIQDCPQRVIVLRGPAASGKTTAGIALYERGESPKGSGGCLLLVPGFPQASAIRRRLLERSPAGVLVRPRVTTFAALAGAIVGGGQKLRRALSPFATHLLLREVVNALSSAGRLGALAAVADTPGLVTALGRAIAELKRAAIEPEDLDRAVRGAGGGAGRGGGEEGKGRDKSGALVEVYRLYQERLRQRGAYDTEGLFWEAREQLSSGPVPGLEGVAVIVADGFTDFGPTQLGILRLLAGRMEKVVITLPLALSEAEEPGGPRTASSTRRRLWRATLRTLEGLRRTFGRDLAEIEATPPGATSASPGAPSLLPGAPSPPAPPLPRSLWDDLFLPETPLREPPQGLEVIAAGGAESEVTAIAWRVKRLLARGAPPGSIAVLARSLEDYRGPIERIFRRCQIPIRPAAEALTDVPIVRFLLGVAGLAPDFGSGEVLQVIKSSYFRPSALGDFAARTVATAEMLIRRGNVVAGRGAYSQAAQRLAQVPERREDEDEASVDLGPLTASPAQVVQAAAMLEALFALAESATSQSPAAGALSVLTERLQLDDATMQSGDAECMARDLRALAALRSALESAEAKAGLADIRQALAAATCRPARGEALVDVSDVLDARAMRYRHVFLLGAAEGQFPQRFSENSIITERQRLAWAPHGVTLDQRRDLTCREALLFYLAVSRAEETLTVCFSESDAAGRPGAPSAMLLSLLAPFGGLEALEARGALHRIPRGRFMTPQEELASPADAVSAAASGLFAPDDRAAPNSPGALSWAIEHRPHVLRALAWGLYARRRRWEAGACDSYDGRISEAPLLSALADHYGPNAVFSASQFNAFGQCPWQFFASYVLGLAPLKEPQRRLEPQTRGSLCHDVLQGVFTRLGQESGLPVRLGQIDPARVEWALQDAVAEQARRIDLRRPPYPTLWKVLQQQVLRQLREYLSAQRERRALQPEALCFELAFGMEAEGGPQRRDPASRPAPVAIATPQGTVQLRGKIDRVDRIQTDTGRRLLVVDYKTGTLPEVDDIAAGRNVQLPLYAAAARELLGEPCAGGVFDGLGVDLPQRWFAEGKLSKGAWKPNDNYPAQQAEALETVGRFVEAIRAGHFDLLPTKKCPGYCPFRRICQYSPARAEAKAIAPAPGEGEPW